MHTHKHPFIGWVYQQHAMEYIVYKLTLNIKRMLNVYAKLVLETSASFYFNLVEKQNNFISGDQTEGLRNRWDLMA